MNDPHKVVIECTAKGYSITVFDEEGAQLAEQSSVMESAGRSKRTGNREWWDDFPDHEDFTEALDDLSFGPFTVSGALHRIANPEE